MAQIRFATVQGDVADARRCKLSDDVDALVGRELIGARVACAPAAELAVLIAAKSHFPGGERRTANGVSVCVDFTAEGETLGSEKRHRAVTFARLRLASWDFATIGQDVAVEEIPVAFVQRASAARPESLATHCTMP
ncbi:MAG: hypothetical protein MUF54_12740 [Polyangiaceae bacterium]|jgi:hypothetical protein|nr:hypothetical protein [Polyangiaceae bacterium]